MVITVWWVLEQLTDIVRWNTVVVVVVEWIYEPYVFSHSVAMSSAECNSCSPPSSLVCRQLLTICDIVWHLSQGQTSVAARPHFFWQDAQWPWLVRKYPVASRQIKSWLLYSGVIHWRGIAHWSRLPFILPLGNSEKWSYVECLGGKL